MILYGILWLLSAVCRLPFSVQHLEYWTHTGRTFCFALCTAGAGAYLSLITSLLKVTAPNTASLSRTRQSFGFGHHLSVHPSYACLSFCSFSSISVKASESVPLYVIKSCHELYPHPTLYKRRDDRRRSEKEDFVITGQ